MTKKYRFYKTCRYFLHYGTVKNQIIKALLELRYLTTIEQDYLVYSLLNGKETYSDAIISIRTSREGAKLDYCQEMQGSSQLSSIQHFKDKGIFELYFQNGQHRLSMNFMAESKYGDMLRRLSFYAVDINKRHLLTSEKKTRHLPHVIKALFIMESPETTKAFGTLTVSYEQAHGQELIQGDFIIFINQDMDKLHEFFVFQIVACNKIPNGFQIEFERRHVINPESEQEIIQMIRET